MTIYTVSLQEAAQLCSTSVLIVRRWVDAGKLALATDRNVGDGRRVYLRELYDFAKARGMQLPEFGWWEKQKQRRRDSLCDAPALPGDRIRGLAGCCPECGHQPENCDCEKQKTAPGAASGAVRRCGSDGGV